MRDQLQGCSRNQSPQARTMTHCNEKMDKLNGMLCDSLPHYSFHAKVFFICFLFVCLSLCFALLWLLGLSLKFVFGGRSQEQRVEVREQGDVWDWNA